MKIQMYSRILHAIVTAVVLVSVSQGVAAQDAPEIEAFIEGLDDFNDYDDPVITSPDLSGGQDLPPNQLPVVDPNEFVVAPELVPERVNEPTGATAAVNEVPSPAIAGNLDPNSESYVSDYFDEHYYNDAPAPAASSWVLGITVPIFDREFDRERLFSVDPADQTNTLNSSSADPNATSGIDINLARRSSTGWGGEVRYWGLYSSAATGVLGGNPTTAINGLSQLNDDSGVALSDIFNTADFHALTREYSFNNVELNLLRNRWSFAPLGRALTFERLYGLRYVHFEESLEYAGVSSTNPIIRSALNSSVENSLFGVQTGGRAEWQVFNRASVTIGGKFGVFNNRARSNIVATNQEANLNFTRPLINSGPNTGAGFEFGDRKDDLSFLGEFEVGLAYQLSRRSRFRIGYRVLGATDISDAERNIPADFTNVSVLQSTNTDADLVLRGGYVGVEFGF